MAQPRGLFGTTLDEHWAVYDFFLSFFLFIFPLFAPNPALGPRLKLRTARIKAPSVPMDPGRAQARFWNQEGFQERMKSELSRPDAL